MNSALLRLKIILVTTFLQKKLRGLLRVVTEADNINHNFQAAFGLWIHLEQNISCVCVCAEILISGTCVNQASDK